MYNKQIVFFILFFVFSCFCLAKDAKIQTHLIHFEGQEYFDESELQEALSVDTKSILLFWRKDIPKIKDKLLPTLEMSLRNFYDSEGFYDANFSIDTNESIVNVAITEGRPVRVADVNISSDYEISNLITFNKDDIFRAKDFVRLKGDIVKKLLNEGYCSYDLDAKAYVDLKKHKVKLQYVLKKGDICTFGDVSIKGLENIDTNIVRSRVPIKKADIFDPKMIKESYLRVNDLDAFDSLTVSADRKFYNEVPIDITAKELEKPYHYEIGAGYDTFVHARVHGLITRRNFFGNAQKATLKVFWSKKEQLMEGYFFKPTLLSLIDYVIDFGVRVGYSNLEYRGFKEKKGYGRFFLEHNEGRLRLRAGLAAENIDISLLGNLRKNERLKQAVNDGTFFLFYPYVNAVFDARDSKLNPKYGYYLSAYMEYGLPYDVDAAIYVKTLLEARYIHTFGDLTLAAVGKFGVVDQASNEIPESKLLFGGGSYSNRAYGYNDLGVILSPDKDSIEGASTMLNLSFEANYPISEKFYAAIFTDNTMLNDDYYDFSGDIINTLGLGIRYITPIGPFKLDVGFNTHDASEYGISFQIGQSF